MNLNWFHQRAFTCLRTSPFHLDLFINNNFLQSTFNLYIRVFLRKPKPRGTQENLAGVYYTCRTTYQRCLNQISLSYRGLQLWQNTNNRRNFSLSRLSFCADLFVQPCERIAIICVTLLREKHSFLEDRLYLIRLRLVFRPSIRQYEILIW